MKCTLWIVHEFLTSWPRLLEGWITLSTGWVSIWWRAEYVTSHKLRCCTGISGPEKSRNNAREKITYFFTCVDINSQLLTRHSPLAPLSQVDEWMAKSSRFSIHGHLSDLSRIVAAKTLKYPYRWQTVTNCEVQTFLEGEKNQHTKRKTESYAFSGFGVGISRGIELKSTTGRFVTGRFWPFI